MIVKECCLEVITRFCSSNILRQSSTLIVYLYFSSTLAFMFFHAMKEHDRTTTKRIQDNRLRVSLLKNTKILIPVHILSQEVSPQFWLNVKS